MNEAGFRLDTKAGYFRNHGVDVMAFDDIYPVGHQSGVSILMHGRRVATNGDLRFEQTPGQWQAVPKQLERKMDAEENTIVTTLAYPDLEQHLTSFNPLIYPDFECRYEVLVKGEGDRLLVTVNLDRPIPEKYAGKICFNMELVPGDLFGKPWMMDGKPGIFPRQANGPVQPMSANHKHAWPAPDAPIKADVQWLAGKDGEYSPAAADTLIAVPYAVGKRFVVRPDDAYHRFVIESAGAELKLYDGRMNHNNGWFVISSEVPAGKTENVVSWVITPHVEKDWLYAPVVQLSQVGYHPSAAKVAVIELDGRAVQREKVRLCRITENGEEELLCREAAEWGRFLRYQYLQFDFSHIREEGLYKVCYGQSESCLFRIAEDIYDRGVWQPVLEYFLPVQMCHMRVNEKYRVWHGLCHNDDARMAPLNHNHFDGYLQGASTLCKYQPGEHVPGLNAGGWHDAGDFDLRVESQAGECYKLALAYEAFGVDYDVTTIDQAAKVTEIHQPDGKNDILQQIEHGLLSVVGGYKALGRLYRGIISSSLRQYVTLGDTAAMTNNIPGDADDRWVFTEDNPPRQLMTAAWLAASSVAIRDFNPALSVDALTAAQEIYESTDGDNDQTKQARVHAAVELFLATGEEKYKAHLLGQAEFISENIAQLGWIVCRAIHLLRDETFLAVIRSALQGLKAEYDNLSRETPYGIPYRPHIWGAGWNIQKMGVEYYYLHRAFPEIFDPALIMNALNFILGCHPGSNTASFASGVGAKSATVAYCMNRADWSYIPGGVVSGTALIRPDFPELLEFPFLWQQTEYVLGGGSSNYMFLVLAAKQLLTEKNN